MNTESHTGRVRISWVPESGIQLRKAGVHFDAVRVGEPHGRPLADQLALLTGGDPGPVIEQANGRRFVYFLVPVGSTGHRPWPASAHRLVGGDRRERDSYVGIPALDGSGWPLTWRYRPTSSTRFVHPLLLHLTACVLTHRSSPESSGKGARPDGREGG